MLEELMTIKRKKYRFEGLSPEEALAKAKEIEAKQIEQGAVWVYENKPVDTWVLSRKRK